MVTVVTVRVRTRTGAMQLVAGVAADLEAVQRVIADDRALRAGRPLLYGTTRAMTPPTSSSRRAAP